MMATSRRPAAKDVHRTVQKHLIGDGFPIVFDLEKSHGSWIAEAGSGEEYLDLYTFFASLPLGFHHPAFQRDENRRKLLQAALHKPANSDAFTAELAEFTEVFAAKAMPAPFRRLFFIEGGALAVENALKAAFDWKVRRNLARGRGELGSKVLHFRQAFHGRSGYTLSLTNTLPVKTDYFPKFDWPRVRNPKLRFPVDAAELERVAGEEQRAFEEIDAAFRRHEHDIAAIIIEPIQGEGGDNHFRGEFLRELGRITLREDALLIFDEVQTGFGVTGRMWAFEHFGVVPDLLCFGKKSQVCGIMAGPRIDEVEENVFRVSSRINSTWGGSLADMVRCQIILEAMDEEELVENAAATGAHLLRALEEVARRHSGFLSQVRGRGLLCAFDCPDKGSRDALLKAALKNRLVILPCGERSIRLRPPLTLSRDEAGEAVRRLERSLVN
jgi:L-lysine 6-transaminase